MRRRAQRARTEEERRARSGLPARSYARELIDSILRLLLIYNNRGDAQPSYPMGRLFLQEPLQASPDPPLLPATHPRHKRHEQPHRARFLHLPRPAHPRSLGNRIEGEAPLGQQRPPLTSARQRAGGRTEQLRALKTVNSTVMSEAPGTRASRPRTV